MDAHAVVSDEAWLDARRALLEKEKAFTRERDALAAERRALPWRKVTKDYAFTGPGGALTLADLFDGRSQLIVYHFMFDPAWDEGCKSCSLIADHNERVVVHLAARDVALVHVSRAPLAQLDAFKERLGWTFPWVSSAGSDFNHDFHASLDPARGPLAYNFSPVERDVVTELPGLSVFARGEAGDVFHTYSVYARGLEDFLGVYRLLDVVPKGRDESDLPYGMAWVRHRDRY